MNSGKNKLGKKATDWNFWNAGFECGCGRLSRHGSLLSLGLGMLLLCGLPALGQPRQAVLGGEAGRDATAGLMEGLNNTAGTGATIQQQLGGQQLGGQQAAGTISGTVVDSTGGVVVGARVKLSSQDSTQNQEAISDGDGQFSLAGIAPGPFQLTITADGFATRTVTGTLHSGENYNVPPIALVISSGSTEVQVAMSRTDLAEAEIKDEEKQRVFGVVPNFYVTYDPMAFPLSRKQKFELAWKTSIDPVSFGLTGAVAGIEQWADAFNGYGQGAEGYGKRYGASYADLVTSTFIGSAVLPSLLKQDPRYFYKGKGSVRSRILYALANAVICKGDNGKWEPNYSSLLGGVASAGISNLYYPAADRNGFALTAENTLIGIGTTAAANLLQEFVIRRLTPHAPNYAPLQP